MVNTRSGAVASFEPDLYGVSEHSSNEDGAATRMRTRSSRVSDAKSTNTSRAVRSSKKTTTRRRPENLAEDLAEAQPPQKRRRTGPGRPRKQEQRHQAVEVEVVEEANEAVEDDQDEESRPTEAFLRNINEGLHGSSPAANTRQGQNRRQTRRPDSRQPSAALSTARSAPQRRDPHNSRRGNARREGQRTLSVEPLSGDVSLPPQLRSGSLVERQRAAESEHDVRDEPSLFVGSVQGSDEDGHPDEVQESIQEEVLVIVDDDDEEYDYVEEEEHEYVDDEEHGQEEQHGDGDDLDEDENFSQDQGLQPTTREIASAEPDDDVVIYMERPALATPQHERPTAKIKADKLAQTEVTISTPDWTGLKKECGQFFLRKPNELVSHWLRRMGSPSWNGGKRMLKVIGKLHHVLRGAPRMPNLNEQNEYFSTHLEDIEDSVSYIQDQADALAGLVVSGTAGTEVRTRFVPLLVLTMREAFRLGGSQGENGEIHPSSEGTFTKSSLDLISILLEVTLELSEALSKGRRDRGDPHGRLQQLIDELTAFQGRLDWGLRIVEERDPERLRRAKERDEAIQRAAQARTQGVLDERRDRMAAFIAGTQRVRQSIVPTTTFGTQLTSTPTFTSTPYTVHQAPEDYDPFLDSDDDAYTGDSDEQLARQLEWEQLEQERVEREKRQAEEQRIARLKEKDRVAREKKEAEVRARREKMELRFKSFVASSQQMWAS